MHHRARLAAALETRFSPSGYEPVDELHDFFWRFGTLLQLLKPLSVMVMVRQFTPPAR
jgi:hypothetical protein